MDEKALDARILAAVTRRGRRLLSATEVAEEGATQRQVDWRLAAGRWQHPYPGVYLIGAGALTWEERQIAAVLAAGETAASSCRAASRLHGIGDYGTPNLVEIKLTHATDVHVPGALVHRSRRPFGQVLVRGVPCTTVNDTLLDLAAVLPPRLLHQSFTTAWRKHLTTPEKVLVHLRDHGGRGVEGTQALRSVVTLYKDCDRGPGSEAEADPDLAPLHRTRCSRHRAAGAPGDRRRGRRR